MIMDKHKLGSPSASTVKTITLLTEWGAELKMRSPQGGMTAAHHQKMWCFDDAVTVVGSHNLTSNSVHRCTEVIHVDKAVVSVRAFNKEFERLWSLAEYIDVTSLQPKAARGSSGSSSCQARRSEPS